MSHVHCSVLQCVAVVCCARRRHPGVDGVNIIEHGHGKGCEHFYLHRKQRVSNEQQRSTQMPWIRTKVQVSVCLARL